MSRFGIFTPSKEIKMNTVQYSNAVKIKEEFFENGLFKFSRFQDPRDQKWYAYVEQKDKGKPFYMFSGPFKLKRKATEQIDTWI
jgi:hypothetical protein